MKETVLYLSIAGFVALACVIALSEYGKSWERQRQRDIKRARSRR